MKKIILFVVLAICIVQGVFAQFNAKVDEKFELTSIVFCLAGAPEYQPGVPSYLKDIQAYFKPYEFTEPIDYIRALIQKHQIGYNAISTTADMLEIKDGKVRLQPQYTIANIVEYDDRWNEETFTKYIEVLNNFYKKSKFNKFFQAHKPLYDSAEQVVNHQINSTAFPWFKSFYGKDLDSSLNVYISLTNGSSNYSILSGVLLGVNANKEGQPYAGERITNLLVHEFSHHYTNDIINSYWSQIEDAANKIFPKVEKQMKKLAYGDSKSMMTEWFIRLCSLMYDRESNVELMKLNMYALNVNNGFIWMANSVDFMDYFYANRDKYPTIKEYMPQLVSFLNCTADNIDFIEKDIPRRPYITSIYPAPGSDISNETEMVIIFSEPMLNQYSSIYNQEMYLPLMTYDELMDTTRHKWSDDGRRYTYKLPTHRLKPGSKYIFNPGNSFMSQKIWSLDITKKIEIIYTTSEK